MCEIFARIACRSLILEIIRVDNSGRFVKIIPKDSKHFPKRTNTDFIDFGGSRRCRTASKDVPGGQGKPRAPERCPESSGKGLDDEFLNGAFFCQVWLFSVHLRRLQLSTRGRAASWEDPGAQGKARPPVYRVESSAGSIFEKKIEKSRISPKMCQNPDFECPELSPMNFPRHFAKEETWGIRYSR